MPQVVNTECPVYTERPQEVEPICSLPLIKLRRTLLFGIGISASHSTDSYLCACHACSMNASWGN